MKFIGNIIHDGLSETGIQLLSDTNNITAKTFLMCFISCGNVNLLQLLEEDVQISTEQMCKKKKKLSAQ